MIVRIERGGAATGQANMLADLEMLGTVQDGDVDIAVRTYTWLPWCVSLGRHQPAMAIDFAKCTELGFDVVRRPTGGRAVLHADEITYCIVIRMVPKRNMRMVYESTHELIYEALSTIVSGLTFSETTSDLRTHYASSGPLGQLCFSSHARSEIMHGARKVVGSAQRLMNGVILQHGSILCGSGHEQISEIVVAEESQRSRLILGIESSSTTLSSIAGAHINVATVEDALHSTFASSLLSRMEATSDLHRPYYADPRVCAYAGNVCTDASIKDHLLLL